MKMLNHDVMWFQLFPALSLRQNIKHEDVESWYDVVPASARQIFLCTMHTFVPFKDWQCIVWAERKPYFAWTLGLSDTYFKGSAYKSIFPFSIVTTAAQVVAIIYGQFRVTICPQSHTQSMRMLNHDVNWTFPLGKRGGFRGGFQETHSSSPFSLQTLVPSSTVTVVSGVIMICLYEDASGTVHFSLGDCVLMS